ncbi:MAG TPA: hypothetical protein VM364_09730 [Vicinamibacterales bacterium]|nr:hypothetical protein [Vicinamibacterales bacterium]
MMNIVGVCAIVACVGCGDTMRNNPPATYPGDTPVGTTGTTATTPSPTQVQGDRMGHVPVGQELDVRLQTSLSSATAEPEQRFEATTAVDLMQGNTVLIPAGSRVRGVVRSVDRAGNIDRTGRLTLAFDRITISGRDYEFRGMATQVFESGGIRDEAATVGTAGAVGAIVGGIIGGMKGALLGAVVGAGGVIAATEGKDIELPAGTVVRVRLDTPIEVR